MDITKDIQPMTTFRNHSAEIMQHLRTTKRLVVLDLAAQANAAEGIRQGLEDLRDGRTRPARVVFEEVRAESDVPR